MSVTNLSSLLKGNWFIEQSYSEAMQPLLLNILSGQKIEVEKPTPEARIISSTGQLTSLADHNAADGQENYVLLVSLKNPIYKYNQSCGPRGTKSKMSLISSTIKDANCKGVVLDIDSGGGQVSGTPEFYDFIKGLSKPVVSYTDGLMCSAAYYIGSAADHIIVNKRADAIGSIGAMVSFLDMSGMFEKKGAKIIKAYATKSTEKNSEFEAMLDGDNKPYIQNVLDPIVETFIDDIKAARKDIDQKVFKGGVYPAEEAVSIGLADELGNIQTAINKVFELSKNSQINPNINSNHLNMNTDNLKRVMAVLALTQLESTKEGAYLNEEQLQAIDDHLADQETAAVTASGALQTANDNLDTAIQDSTAIAGAVSDACATAEVENAENLTTAEGVSALSGLIAEYGEKDGDQHTNPKSKGDTSEEVDPNIVGNVNVAAAMNN